MDILIVDDHKAMREQMVKLICAEPDLAVIAEAENGEEGMAKAKECHPDLVVMDLVMPGVNGIEASRAILEDNPAVTILALSNHGGKWLVEAVLSSGVRGYVRKDRAYEDLIPAIRAVTAGERYVSDGADD